MIVDQERLLPPKEAAAWLSITVKQLSALTHGGEISYIVVGSSSIRPRRRYTKADLADFVERRRKRESRPFRIAKGHRVPKSISDDEIVSFSDLRNTRLAEKMKKLTH